jgi:hypothetical protein
MGTSPSAPQLGQTASAPSAGEEKTVPQSGQRRRARGTEPDAATAIEAGGSTLADVSGASESSEDPDAADPDAAADADDASTGAGRACGGGAASAFEDAGAAFTSTRRAAAPVPEFLRRFAARPRGARARPKAARMTPNMTSAVASSMT